MIVLGLNAYHGDSAACILKDGHLIAAAEEERFRRIKHWAGFPSEAMRYCLREAGTSLADVDAIALNQDARANLLRKLGYLATRRPDLSLVMDRIRNKRKRAGLEQEIARCFPSERFKGRLHEVEHHVAHLASAFLASPFAEALAVSVDGFGDFASAAWGNGSEADGRVYFPHSLGVFYQALTQYLGFSRYGDEYKVMGLAPYGQPTLMVEMRRLVRLNDDGTFELGLDYFRHHSTKVEYEWDEGEPVVGVLYSPELEALLGPARKPEEPLTQRHKDIARSAQAMYEEAFFQLLNRLHAKYRFDALCLSGGCAMNSVANGKVYRETPFKRLYVQAAAGDAGGAIGAALVAAGGARICMEHAYWGPAFSDEDIAALPRRGAVWSRVESETELCEQTARAIADGQIVGWFQGRMEWGPRALGNRSILCDPRRANMKDILNAKIKRRESFRPFAPSILREAVREWFETDDDVPFMAQVYPIRPEKRPLIPAVTHVDGSGRLQTVTREANPRFYGLIEHFRDLTGVPMLLNTSFNENEPVVCSPEEALECFLRTQMDVLVMQNWFVRRGKAAS